MFGPGGVSPVQLFALLLIPVAVIVFIAVLRLVWRLGDKKKIDQ